MPPARMALIVTSAGGPSRLGRLLIFGVIVESYEPR